MSTKFPGGFITKSPVAPTATAASGIWTLDQQQQAQRAGTWPSPPIFIEDLFSTWLIKPPADFTNYSINNGVDLLGKGGMTWFKARDAAQNNIVYDTVRGSSSGNANALITNSTSAQQTTFWDFVTPNSNGFTVNFASGGGQLTNSGINYVSWTFREQAKFFDVVTWTGNGANRTIAHNLGSVPGCIIVKRTDTTADWQVYHRSLANTQYLVLNDTAAVATGATRWNSTTPTSTVFSLGTDASVNASGGTYVAYIYAHDAGGFPASGSGSTNGISCGSFTTDGSGNATVNLGYEPQWVLVKRTDSSSSGNWYLLDNMRGFLATGTSAVLNPNTSSATINRLVVLPSATGFYSNTNTGEIQSFSSYIYIAIRRGPMKVPTDATKVFSPNVTTSQFGQVVTTGFPTDFIISMDRNGGNTYVQNVEDSLRGYRIPGLVNTQKALSTAATYAEVNSGTVESVTNTGWTTYNGMWANSANLSFQRAPGFFDVCCYTGTGVARTVAHNLGVAPELVLIKNRGVAAGWGVGGNVFPAPLNDYLILQSTAAKGSVTNIYQSFTSTTFGFGSGNPSDGSINANTNTYVAYLFASCPGVSKVGSYTGTGATQTINCGFTGGARFVLIKRTDSTGDWYVWDTARGMIPANDPYLLLNSTAAEVTGTDYVDTTNVGFEITSTAPAAINASGGTFIFLAIA